MASTSTQPQSRPKKPKPLNSIEAALRSWFSSLPDNSFTERDVEELIAQAPKRWVVYEPMVLLPAGSFSSEAWRAAIASAPGLYQQRIWTLILHEVSRISRGNYTHLAANEGIPLRSEDAEENVLRSPSGLRTLHGNFGPATLLTSDVGATKRDFDAAFWVSTRQNGIYQTWAPRWTMFSRGNVKEKARVLDFHSPSHSQPTSTLVHRRMDKAELKDKWAVDLYAGIGYFVFSYAKLGMRVLCWELNPWSVEGLRRGAVGNGWSVRVIQGLDLASVELDGVLMGDERIIVFLESNEMAVQRASDLNEEKRRQLDIRHLNGGFLPTSEPMWRGAWRMTSSSSRTWLHLHENVGVNDISRRQTEVQDLFDGLAKREGSRQAQVEHVELVKTFAPGVWHCVFDVYISRSQDIT